jgi:hypothetical protein
LDVASLFLNAPAEHAEAAAEIISIYDTYSHENGFRMWIGITPDDGLIAYAKFISSVEVREPDSYNLSLWEFRPVNLELTTFISEHGVEMTQIKTKSGMFIAMGG